MPYIKCKNQQCGADIAYINGTVPKVKCDNCRTVRRIYHDKPTRAIRLTMKGVARSALAV